ncbi:MAG: hypothetical protein Q9201_001841 [Fulgogasparrea decipioides]
MAPPKDLHPTATGHAKALVDAHQKPQPLVLYAGWFCPFGIRRPLPLPSLSSSIQQIPYQYIEVNPYSKPSSLLRLNPRGLVPTLQYSPSSNSDNKNNNNKNDELKPLYESNVICEFLEDAYPGHNHGPALLPKDPYEKARCRIWMDFVTTRFIPSFHRFLQFQPSDTRPSIDVPRQEFHAVIREFADAMSEYNSLGPWFLGQEMSMVDLCLAPWAVRLWVFDHFKDGGLGIPAEGESGDDGVWKRWREWVGAVEGRKSVRETGSEREMYLPIYKP